MFKGNVLKSFQSLLWYGTYKINNVGMSLYDILVEDGCGDYGVIAYCFVPQETKISTVNFLQIFKKYNPKCYR